MTSTLTSRHDRDDNNATTTRRSFPREFTVGFPIDPGDLTRLWSLEQTPDEQAYVGDVRLKLIALWAEAAVRHAIVRPLEDTDEFTATVAGLRGAWGAGHTAGAALSDLQSVLIDWATLKLDDGDRDIPDMEGIRLVLDT